MSSFSYDGKSGYSSTEKNLKKMRAKKRKSDDKKKKTKKRKRLQ